MTPLEEAFRSLFETNMGIRRGERVVVFSDTIRTEETLSEDEAERRTRLLETARKAARFSEMTYGATLFVDFAATAASGAEPPEPLWRAVFGGKIISLLEPDGLLSRLLSKQASEADLNLANEIVSAHANDVAHIVVALSNNSTSHTKFRALVNRAGGRFASLPHFDPEMFFTSMRVDWDLLATRTSALAAAVNEAVEIVVETDNGTNMRFCKRGRNAAGDDGLLCSPGSFGNLPAGEVYLAPVEGMTEGTMVIEYAPTRKLSEPLHLTVREGNVVEVAGNDPYRLELEGKFAESPKNRNIAELGIGTNDRASRPDNVLEAEKILGTIHIALGDNSGFGGCVHTPFHEDFVFYRPTLTAILADGSTKILLRRGTLLVSPA